MLGRAMLKEYDVRRSRLRDEKVKIEQLRKEKNIASCPHLDPSMGAESHPDIRAWKAVEKVSHCVNAQLSLGLEIHDTVQDLRSAYIRIRHQTEVPPHPKKGVNNPCSTQRRQSLPAPKDLLKSVMVASGIIDDTYPLREKERHQPSTSAKDSGTPAPGSSLRKTYPVYSGLGLDSRKKKDTLAAAVSGSDRTERSDANSAAPSDPPGVDGHVPMDMPSSSGNVEQEAAMELHPVEDFDEFFKQVLNPAPAGAPDLYPELDDLLAELGNVESKSPVSTISPTAENAPTAAPLKDIDLISASSSVGSPSILVRLAPLETTNLSVPAKPKGKPGRPGRRARKAASPEEGSSESSDGQGKPRVPKRRRHASKEKKNPVDVITLSSGEESNDSNPKIQNTRQQTKLSNKRRKVEEETRASTPVSSFDSREDTPVTDDSEPGIGSRLKSRRIQEQAEMFHKRGKVEEETREVSPATSLDSREDTPVTDDTEPGISRRLKSGKVQELAEVPRKRGRPKKGTRASASTESDEMAITSTKFNKSRPLRMLDLDLEDIKTARNALKRASCAVGADVSTATSVFRAVALGLR